MSSPEIDPRITSHPTRCGWQWYCVELTELADGTYSAKLGDVVTRDRDPSKAARCCIIKFNLSRVHDWPLLFEQYDMEAKDDKQDQE